MNGTAEKPELTCSPFVKELNYGTQEDGYWTYDQMILQTEDVVDCLKVLYPQFDYLLLFVWAQSPAK